MLKDGEIIFIFIPKLAISVISKTKKYFLRTLLITGLTLFGLFLLLLIAINLPPIQNYILTKITKRFSEQTHFSIKIDRLSMRWFDRVVIYDVSITDSLNHPMIVAKEIEVDINLTSLIYKPLTLDNVKLDEAEVNLLKDSITQTFNITRFVKAFSSKEKKKDSISTTRFYISEIELNKSKFNYVNELKPSVSNTFDYNHFGFSDIQANLSNLKVKGDTFEINIKNLITKEKNTKIPIHYLSTFFSLGPKAMSFTNLHILIGKSQIKDSIVFEFSDMDDMSDFERKVKIDAHLAQCYIHTDDLSWFAPSIKTYHDRWGISGKLKGRINRFDLKDFTISFGKKNSTILGDASLNGLPNFKETFIELVLKPSVIFAKDLENYIQNPKAIQFTNQLKKVKLQGDFIGFPEDFVANATFDTDVGFIKSDINVKLAYDSIKGNLITKDLDIGKILNEPSIQRLDFKGSLVGKGFSLDKASYRLDAICDKLEFKNYAYQNIQTHAKLADQYFEGTLQINDPYLAFNTEGKIDFRDNKDLINIKAHLDSAVLHKLNLSEKPITIKTDININARGFKDTDLEGKAEFKETIMNYGESILTVPSILIESSKKEMNRSFIVNSPFININASGDFSLGSIYENFASFIKEHQLRFSNHEAAIKNYYKIKNKQKEEKKSDDFFVDYQIILTDINPIINLFYKDLFISTNTVAEGRFSKEEEIKFNTTIYSDTIVFQGNRIKGLEAELSTSKKGNEPSIHADLLLISKSQILKNITETKNLQLEVNWLDEKINFKTYIEQKNIENYVDINGSISFLKDTTELQFESSVIKLFDKKWSFNKSGKIDFTNTIAFKNVSIDGDNQFIRLNGSLQDSLFIKAENFDLNIVETIINKNMEGRINGYAEITNKNKKITVESNLQIDSLVYDNFYIGDIEEETHWNDDNYKIQAALKISRKQQEMLNAEGYYDPNDKKSPLYLTASLTGTPLVILEPFSKSFISDLEGKANGKLEITGQLTDPIITGVIDVINGGFKLNYLSTHYIINDKITFSDKGIFVKDLKLIDENKNYATVNGGLVYDQKRNMIVNLSGRLRKFKLLDTQLEENQTFYGTALVTGSFSIQGPFDDLYIKADVTTIKGTKVYIPIKGYDRAEKQEYIRFVEKRTPLLSTTKKEKRKIKLTGIRIDFTLDVTSDALCEIIFDLRVGDVIRTYGNGILKLKIDTKGEFSMTGNYEIEKGDYKFTLANIISKEFKILPNSKIVWYGDPYMANMDIKASYTQKLSYVPILALSPEVKPSAALRRLYPVIVELYLKGNLTSPDIAYNILFKDYPSQIGDVPIQERVSEFKARIASDEQELNRQVFSLIILKKLSPPNSFEVSQGSASSSVSELLASQLSFLLSQYDENLQVDLTLNDLTSESLSNAQLTLSYAFLGGRLKVTRSGSFSTTQSTSAVGNLIGEWIIEYDLTTDGKLKMKIFNRNNQNPITNTNFTGSTNSTTAGVSLLHSQSFNSIKELFRKKKQRQPRNTETSDTPPINKDAKKEEEPTPKNQ